MALGQYNSDSKKDYSPNVYGYSFSNPVSEIDQTNISFSMWKSSLKVSISPKIGDGENATYDHANAISIYLSHTKARILSIIIRELLTSKNKDFNKSVQSGSGLITVTTGKYFGKEAFPIIIIQKISDNGAVEAQYAYQFKRNWNCSINDFNPDNGKFTKDFDTFANMEIEQFVTMLESYYNAMTGAVAFSVCDNMNYTMQRIQGNQAKIAGKLGVELYTGRSGSRNNFFSNNGSGDGEQSAPAPSQSSRTTSTLEELDNM